MLLLSTEELYRVCTEGQTCAALHSQEQIPVQDLVVCDITAIWIRNLHFNHAEHSLLSYEVPWGARGLHSCPWYSQSHLHCCLCPWVCPQDYGLQIQGNLFSLIISYTFSSLLESVLFFKSLFSIFGMFVCKQIDRMFFGLTCELVF